MEIFSSVVKEEMKVYFKGDVAEEQRLESARVEMEEVKQENERLKTTLSKIMKDYESLKSQFLAIPQTKAPIMQRSSKENGLNYQGHENELLSLSLGTSNTKDGEKRSIGDMRSGDLSLALQCSSRIKGPDQSSEVVQKDGEESEGQNRPPSNVLGKSLRNDGKEISSLLMQNKKARVSVRARCDAPTMYDGCQWRKYGQKISKGNPRPRAYYRCTVSPGCPVRKQVQRCAEDMSVLITTYEGTHNHPLPLAATNIASTTSAAASMLLSPSSTASSLATNNLSFGLPQSSRSLTPPFPHLSPTPFRSPTITLDLTTPQQLTPSTLSFSSYPSLAGGYFNNQFYNNSESNSKNRSFFSHLSNSSSSQQEVLSDTLAKAITSDPSFKSALAVAITSVVESDSSRKNQDIPTPGTGSECHHLNKPSVEKIWRPLNL